MIFEIIRVTKANTHWIKNSIPISFPVNGLVFPGSDRKYSIIGTCNHKGSLGSGHWFTKLRMNDGRWFVLDDLQPQHSVAAAPGTGDSSTVLLVLLARIAYLRCCRVFFFTVTTEHVMLHFRCITFSLSF